jgi:hypothetical protein
MPGIMREAGQEVSLRLLLAQIERALAAHPAGQGVLLMDLGEEERMHQPGMSYIRSWIGELKAFVKALSPVMSEHYAETYTKIYFVRVPFLFWAVWKVVSLFLPARTQQKVSILTSNTEELLQHLPAETLPRELGGTNTVDTVRRDGAPTELSAAQAHEIGLQPLGTDGFLWEGVGGIVPEDSSAE